VVVEKKEVIVPLKISCSVSDRNLLEGDTSTFTANPVGGRGSYTYQWLGPVSATSKSVTKQFNNEGSYYASVRVTDSAGTMSSANCESVVVKKIVVNNPLKVSCSVSDTSLKTGESTTFTANPSGGNGSYTYQWTGPVGATSKSVTKKFNTVGTFTAKIKVTDGAGNTATANCSPVVVDEEETVDDLEISCSVSDTSVEEGDRVTFTSEVDGGNGPYEYDWSGDLGDDDNDTDEESYRTTYDDEGRYEVEVEVTDDDGNVSRDTCSRVKVESDEDDRDVDVTTTDTTDNEGDLASVDSVYLNQVPYTGPEDVAKGIAFAVGILAWSIGGALMIRNKMQKKVISNRIEAFKNANRNR
jgi:PKD repeat protein